MPTPFAPTAETYLKIWNHWVNELGLDIEPLPREAANVDGVVMRYPIFKSTAQSAQFTFSFVEGVIQEYDSRLGEFLKDKGLL